MDHPPVQGLHSTFVCYKGKIQGSKPYFLDSWLRGLNPWFLWRGGKPLHTSKPLVAGKLINCKGRCGGSLANREWGHLLVGIMLDVLSYMFTSMQVSASICPDRVNVMIVQK